MINKIQDYKEFTKFGLARIVVLSAGLGFLYADHTHIDWLKLIILLIGGFLVTGASNGFNQIMERDLDALMKRTAQRPLPDNRMSTREGLWLALLMATLGVTLLTVFVNFLCAILAALSLVLYTLVYTPSKQVTPWSVFLGAIPGATSPMLGYIAVTNHIDFDALLLFGIQFIWQFPHFWAIAWVLDEDYSRAGFKMLPSKGGRTKESAFQALVYSASLLPIGILPYTMHRVNGWATIIIIVAGIIFTLQAIRLYKQCSVEAARKLMFGSFIYLPVVQLAMVLGKI